MALMPRRSRERCTAPGVGELQARVRQALDLRGVVAHEQHDALRQQLDT